MIPARVLVSYGSHGIVSTDHEVLDCRWRRGTGRPLCGDRVEIRRLNNHEAALEAITPRHSEFQRGDARGRPQVIAANVEQVVVVVAPRPPPSDFMVDRYLVAIAAMGLQPLLVMNKVELLPAPPGSGADGEQAHPSQPGNAQAGNLLERMGEYTALGVPLITASTKGAPGTGALADALHGKVSILVGQSGVGKSSLINNLIPDRDEQTGALSLATGKGRHTTTRTLWINLPGGGAVIDSPGVWEYGLWHMEAESIAHCFPDFASYLGQCRFRNCLHKQEPGCAVREAVARGKLPQRRLQAYLNILAMQGHAV